MKLRAVNVKYTVIIRLLIKYESLRQATGAVSAAGHPPAKPAIKAATILNEIDIKMLYFICLVSQDLIKQHKSQNKYNFYLTFLLFGGV